MESGRKFRLGDLQLKILQILWSHGPATVGEVHRQLGQRWAYTTVATMLRKMEARNLVRHCRVQRRLVYQPLVSENEVSRGMIQDLFHRLFHGSLATAVSFLLESPQVSAQELDELERLIRAHKESAGKRGPREP